MTSMRGMISIRAFFLPSSALELGPDMDRALAMVQATETVKLLQSHHWSGNVRELANVLEHAVILSDGRVIRPEDLPRSVNRGALSTSGTALAHPAMFPAKVLSETLSDNPKTLRETIHAVDAL